MLAQWSPSLLVLCHIIETKAAIDLDTLQEFEKPDLPAFLDYDCDLVGTRPGAVADWNWVYKRVQSSFKGTNPLKSNFSFPAEFTHLVVDGHSSRSENLPAKALAECPLGSMYLLLLYFYEGLTVKNVYNLRVEKDIPHSCATRFHDIPSPKQPI